MEWRGTDTFYLTEDCYVTIYVTSVSTTIRNQAHSCAHAWIGDSQDTLILAGVKFEAYYFNTPPDKLLENTEQVIYTDEIHGAKAKLMDIILKHKELLIEYVKSQL